MDEYERRLAQLESQIGLLNQLQTRVNYLEGEIDKITEQPPVVSGGGGGGVEVFAGTVGDGVVNLSLTNSSIEDCWDEDCYGTLYYRVVVNVKGCVINLGKKPVLDLDFGTAMPITLTSYTSCQNFNILSLKLNFKNRSYSRYTEFGNPRNYKYELQISYK